MSLHLFKQKVMFLISNSFADSVPSVSCVIWFSISRSFLIRGIFVFSNQYISRFSRIMIQVIFGICFNAILQKLPLKVHNWLYNKKNKRNVSKLVRWGKLYCFYYKDTIPNFDILPPKFVTLKGHKWHIRKDI